tara:strand:+ start:478 stop:1056 length:579 start_codon:yes stop_codon:yes gene_type:complete
MSTKINSLPNEVSENPNNIKLNVVEQKPDIQSMNENNTQTQLSQESINQIVQGLQQAANTNMTSLPSRDIPTDKMSITNDETIQPNHIPQANNTNYIDDVDSIENMILKNKTKNTEKDYMEKVYEEFQTPLIIMVLYVFFQMPYVQKNMVGYFPNLFYRDGNPTLGGILFKSFIFALLYYGLYKTTNQLSEL